MKGLRPQESFVYPVIDDRPLWPKRVPSGEQCDGEHGECKFPFMHVDVSSKREHENNQTKWRTPNAGDSLTNASFSEGEICPDVGESGLRVDIETPRRIYDRRCPPDLVAMLALTILMGRRRNLILAYRTCQRLHSGTTFIGSSIASLRLSRSAAPTRH